MVQEVDTDLPTEWLTIGPITPHTVVAAAVDEGTIHYIVLGVVSDVDGVDRQ